jgi:urease accessory protein
MKLIRIGQNACQHILHRSLENIGTEIDTAIASPPDGWFNPLLEIASLRHARSNARLFIS